MNEATMSTYRNLLVEIKYRVEALDDLLTGQVRMRAPIAEEHGYLQLRMICELIAMGCLVIHGDVPVSASVRKSYKADWIISEMARLHPKFFPVALETNDRITADGIRQLTKKRADALTQEDLARLWSREAGNLLHRSLRTIDRTARPVDFGPLQEWRDKIVQLLDKHQLTAPDEETLCVFGMSNENGEVYSALFKLRAA